MTTVTLSQTTRAAIDSVVAKAAAHYDGVVALFCHEILPTITATDISTDAAGNPVEVLTVDPDLWTATLTATMDSYRTRVVEQGLTKSQASTNIRQYRRRIVAKVTAMGITVPGLEEAQDAAAQAQTAAATDDAAAEDLVANGDPIAAVVDALQQQQWSTARAIIRAMQKAAKAAK